MDWTALITAFSALVVVAGGVIAPILLARSAAAQVRKDKQQEYERADAVTARLDRIHALVNEKFAAEMKKVLGAFERQLDALMVVVGLERELGREPSSDSLGAIEMLKSQIAEQRRALIELAEVTAAADEKVKGT